MKTVKQRITELRKLMKERGIAVYYIPNEDDHLSEEYTAAYYQCKSYISGFSGDAGCTIVTKDFAGLWTDGRYFTQAEGELKGTGVKLMRMRQPGVPTPLQFVVDHTPEKGTVGFDGSVVSASASLWLSAKLKEKKAKMHISEDLAGMVWDNDRPDMPQEMLYLLPKKYTGESAAQRIDTVRAEMKENGADVLVLSALEDPCWLLNIRGNDIPYTPVAYAFAMITMRRVYYYISLKKVDKKVRKYLKESGVTVKSYDALAKDISAYHDKSIWADLSTMNTNLYANIASDNTILNKKSPIELHRAIKNRTEIRNSAAAQIKDGTAMVKFIRWVKDNAPKGKMTELSAQDRLYALRAEQKDYIEPSFETIAAYQANGAMMHYTATKDNYSVVKPHGFLLVDSGGTYRDGSTDITRTIAVGPLTAEEKKYYTLVLKGHLDLANAVFLEGTYGNNLDILAREPLWNLGIDYQCGTGHGVGHVLGVHEGPHGIRWGMRGCDNPEAVLRPGMIVTDEPGVYLPHKLGIRIENDLLVVKDVSNFYGQFLKFESMTLCPYDLDAIDVKYLTDENINEINEYHKNVYRMLSPNLNNTEKRWLKKATAALKR